MTNDIAQRLAAPFSENDIEWRVSRAYNKNDKMGAFVLAYITSRAVMDRFDSVVGVDGWKDDFDFIGTDVVCRLSVKFGDEWITKTDGAPQTNFEGFKGGISDALKRAAVKFGPGRYLYNLPETHVEVVASKPGNMSGWHYIDDKTKQVKGYWRNPTLPSWAKPATGNNHSQQPKPATPAPKTDDIAKRVEDARAYFLKNAPEKWAKICADCNLEKPDMPALAMSDDLLQKVLAAATANAQNGGKE